MATPLTVLVKPLHWLVTIVPVKIPVVAENESERELNDADPSACNGESATVDSIKYFSQMSNALKHLRGTNQAHTVQAVTPDGHAEDVTLPDVVEPPPGPPPGPGCAEATAQSARNARRDIIKIFLIKYFCF